MYEDRKYRDEDYLNFLRSGARRELYLRRKAFLEPKLPAILTELSQHPVEEVMKKFNLNRKDIALFVRLDVVTDEESVAWGLDEIERVASL